MAVPAFLSATDMADSAFFCPLPHEGILAVRGPDANKFLQGQLTCNLNYLVSSSSLGARCTPKGRMQSSFRIVPHGDGYLLAMALELLEAQCSDLKKYAIFSKVQVSDESSQWSRFGLSQGDAVLHQLGLELPVDGEPLVQAGELLALRLRDGRAELWVPAVQAAAIQAHLAEQLPQAPLNDWLLAQVRAGIGQVFGATRELFIPQMINLQAIGGVSFKKGCYAGQEIVARMQYLGKLKRRLYRLSLSAEQVPDIGTDLFSSVHTSSVGNVVLAARAQDHVEVLAVAQEDALLDLHLGHAEGSLLTLCDLPYQLDVDREIQQ
jgi:folate-binding protein YgfZ